MKRAVIYTRVSRDDSGEGKSNERQEEQCRKLADLRGWEVVGVQEDISISAFSGKHRPAWERTLQMVETGQIDVVIAWHVDRMTRSMLDLEHLIVLAEKHNVGIATVSGDIDLTTDVGRMVARILAAVARAEVERKSARQKLANAQRATSGMAHSGGVRPFGYDRDYVTVIPAEAEAIRQAAIQALNGVPLIEIARAWHEAGLVSSRAHRARGGWTARGVKNVLVNPRYAGSRIYLGLEVAEGQWEAILDRETHLALVAALNDPTRTKGTIKQGRTPTTLLTSIGVCHCGTEVRAASVRGRATYKCKSSTHGSTDRAEADGWVIDNMIALLSDPDILAQLIPDSTPDNPGAKAKATKLRERLNRLASAFASGLIDEEQLTLGSKMLRDELAVVEREVLTSVDGGLLAGLSIGTDDVATQWADLPLARQRALVDYFLDITFHPAGRVYGEAPPIEEQIVVTTRRMAELEAIPA